jgi:hypothetical protein
VLGGIFALLFSGRIAFYTGPETGGGREPISVPLDFHSQARVVLAGMVIGLILAALGWLGSQGEPGTVLYWALAGAGTGGTIGAKLWTVAEDTSGDA